MTQRVRVRRDRPSALTWAMALAVTMLIVYLATLGASGAEPKDQAASGARVTREMTFEGCEVYFADLGVYADAVQARVGAAALSQRGAAGVIYEDMQGFHVLGAAYSLEADARRIAQQIAGEETLETAVLTRKAEPVEMRVTAPEEDVGRIAGADRVLRQQLEQAGSMALRLDRGELTSTAVKTLAAVSRSELRTAKRELESIAGAAEHPVCAGLMEQLNRLADALGGAARGPETGAALSGRLRCCHVAGMLRLVDFLNGLNA